MQGCAAFDLSVLLSPVGKEEFLSRFWERRHLAVHRRQPGYFTALLSTRDVDALVQLTRLKPADPGLKVVATIGPSLLTEGVRMRTDGSADMGSLYKSYGDGFTIVVNGLHSRDRTIAQLAANLEAELHHPVGVNLYMTPPRAQGFQPHYDNHDVFIVQVEGEKTWRLYEGAVALPLARDTGSTTREKLGKAIDEVVLKQGDTLYLPRGCVHEALTAERPSLHLTVGMHVTTWADFLHELVAHTAANEVEFRRALPPGFLCATDRGAADVRARELLQRLLERARGEKALDRLAKNFLSKSTLPPDGHFDTLKAESELGLESVVRHRAGAICFVAIGYGRAAIHFQGNYVDGPVGLAPALKFISQTPMFRIRDLPGKLSNASKLVLAKRLVREGLLALTGAARIQGGAHAEAAQTSALDKGKGSEIARMDGKSGRRTRQKRVRVARPAVDAFAGISKRVAEEFEKNLQ